jgi:hypothetical protein
VDGQPDRPPVVGHGPADRLADPPGGIGRELEAAPELEAIDRLHQADVAFLDEVQQRQTPVGVALRDRDDQPQVGLEQLALGVADPLLVVPDLLEHLARSAGG